MSANIQAILKEIFFNVFQNLNDESFRFDKNRAEFENWDSLTHMQLTSEIENAFKINFEMDEIVDINKPEDFVNLIIKKQNG